MAELGFDVVGLDVDERKVAALNDGFGPFFEPDLEELLRKNLDAGRVRFTTSYDDATAAADVHFVCVGTPQKRDEYAADLTHVDAAMAQLAPRLTRPCTVV